MLDQFQLGVFGLITPKAMACGATVLTSYEDHHNAWCFPVPPPVVPCASSGEIAHAITRLLGDAEARRHQGLESQAWVAGHHSSKIVADRLSQAMASASRQFAARRREGP